MGNKFYHRNKSLSLVQQKMALIELYPEGICSINQGVLIWSGKIKPTTISREYNIKIMYKGFGRPKVLLVDKNIKGIDKVDFPHHYGIDKSNNTVDLCLYMNNEFDDSKLIAIYIIPWIKEWLFYYELWLSTGEWMGGGHS